LPLSASYLRVVTTEQTKNARSSISELLSVQSPIQDLISETDSF
jgi:hypothetical protein